MMETKALKAIPYRYNTVREFLENHKTEMNARLFCYVFLILKRPDLFLEEDRPALSLQYFQWRRFRGISITERDIGRVKNFLEEIGTDITVPAWNYPSSPTVRANLRNRVYMREAAWRIEWDIQKREVLGHHLLSAMKGMGSGFKLLSRFRRLLKRESALRARDVQRRLHVTAKLAEWLISNEEKAGHVRVRQFSPRGSLWVMRP